ncbi:PAS domain S-box-containing protein [bacterium A37T11]|nr:PAS domain S-box-containing protein [bacterium A37T11]
MENYFEGFAFVELERKILSLNATAGISMTHLLTEYLAGVESLFPGMYCSILRVGDGRLKSIIAPSIPETFLPKTISLPIEEGAGSCGTAAYRKQIVVVNDIATDPIWEQPRELALAHGLRACWSYPILDANNMLLAVLGMYYKEVKTPVAKEMDAIHRVASLLRILLENRKNANQIAETTNTLVQVQELASFGIWQWDTVTDEVTWSDILYTIFAVSESKFDNSKNGLLAFIAEEDRERVAQTLEHVRAIGEDTIFEARICRPDGTIRHLRFWAKLVKGGKYHPRIVGACLDITAIKSAESDLKEIAWMQSHIIRAPVARILGLVDFIKHNQAPDIPIDDLLEAIYESAHELDRIVNTIVRKAEQKGS